MKKWFGIKLLLIFFIIVSLSMILTVAHAIHELLPAETLVPLPGANGKAVYKYITVEDSYKKWALWPEKGKFYKGKTPHGAFLTTYINDNARFSIKAGEPMLNGSLIVKENYTAEKKFTALSVMYKINGYNPPAGDWFWIKYGPDGTVLTEGIVSDCIKCHSAKKNNDYIFTGAFIK
jgi:hypothetical protein